MFPTSAFFRFRIAAPIKVELDRQMFTKAASSILVMQHFRKKWRQQKMGFLKTLLGGTAVDYLNEGKSYLERGLYHDAIEALEESIRLNPKIADAYLYRGNAYFAEDDFGQAITDYGQAIMIDPNLALAYHMRGLAYWERNDVSRSTADQQRANQLDPNVGKK
jgi:tetratricopeptide (TPR) repeat protein